MTEYPVVLSSLNLKDAYVQLCETALSESATIVNAASKLGITRHALRRLMDKHDLIYDGIRRRPKRIKANQPARQRAPINWDGQPLGKVRDSDIAQALGVSRERVRQVRVKKGIPKFKPQDFLGREDWDDLLGNIDDKNIAKQFNISVKRVANRRGKFKIKSPKAQKYINWDDQPLGDISDSQLARETNRTPGNVRTARARRDIKPLIPSQSKNIDWDNQPLGEVYDSEIAAKLGCSSNAVSSARARRNILAFSKKKKR